MTRDKLKHGHEIRRFAFFKTDKTTINSRNQNNIYK